MNRLRQWRTRLAGQARAFIEDETGDVPGWALDANHL